MHQNVIQHIVHLLPAWR